MRRKALLCSFLTLLAGGMAFADTTETVTINGSEISKSATALAFSGDNVTLTYDDATTETVDMALVSINFNYDGTTGINEINAAGESVKNYRVYNTNGQLVGNSLNGLHKGVYVVNGKKIVVK